MRWLSLLFTVVFLWPCDGVSSTCQGRFVNPISDICWRCIFPLKIASITVVSGDLSDPDEGQQPIICSCPSANPLTGYRSFGIPISFWEPARLVDVTRTPYCLVNLGGIHIANTGVVDRGHVSDPEGDGSSNSYYNVHWYVYPLLYILEVLTDFICLEEGSIDVGYMTEIDPFWNDDEISQILNPEAILFGNPIAQAACAADCIASSFDYPLDILFWCNGCQGSIYPFTGTVNDHTGGVQASLLVMGRFMAKLHREGLLKGYMGIPGLCGKFPMPVIRKSQYRTQMTYPVSQSYTCQAFGATSVIWQAGREYPYGGEDFGYLVWRKRDCCLRPLF
ncbi:MAG: TraU family protein [Simkaniaceae bacterium]|nr:TraU family protein [Simkaniaceae bacterium]